MFFPFIVYNSKHLNSYPSSAHVLSVSNICFFLIFNIASPFLFTNIDELYNLSPSISAYPQITYEFNFRANFLQNSYVGPFAYISRYGLIASLFG